MTWLAGQVWPYLLVSTLAGVVLTVVMSTRTHKVERWVPVPVEDVEPLRERREDPEEAPHAADPGPEPSSPFPPLLGQPDARPWEAEELWSRPVRQAADSPEPTPRQDAWVDGFPYAQPLEADHHP